MATAKQEQLRTKLTEGKHAYKDLVKEEKQLMRETLRPAPGRGFTDEQRQFLQDWYLLASQALVDGMNDRLAGTRTRVPHRVTLDGRVVVNADLLTDCLEPQDTYYLVRDTLATLPPIVLLADEFPVTQDES